MTLLEIYLEFCCPIDTLNICYDDLQIILLKFVVLYEVISFFSESLYKGKRNEFFAFYAIQIVSIFLKRLDELVISGSHLCILIASTNLLLEFTLLLGQNVKLLG